MIGSLWLTCSISSRYSKSPQRPQRTKRAKRIDTGIAGHSALLGALRTIRTLWGRNPGRAWKGIKIAEMVESAQFGYSWHARRGLEARFEG